MLFLILSIVTTAALFVQFKLFSRFQVDTFQAIVVNYGVCVLVGSLVYGKIDWLQDIISGKPWVLAAFVVGTCFVFVFLLTGLSIQWIGMQVTTLAGKMALVVPVLASVWLFGNAGKMGYLGIVGIALALGAVWLSSWKPAAGKVGGWLGFSFPLLVFAGMGFTDTFVNYTNAFWMEHGKEDSFSLIVFLAAFVIGLSISFVRHLSNRKILSVQSFVGGIGLGIPNYFSLYFLLLALKAFNNNGSFVFPVANLGVILLTTLFAATIFKEKLYAINWFGLVLAVVSLWLLAGN